VPEPVDTRGAVSDTALAESMTQAFLLLLERLSPGERAAFLLRIVFDYEYAEIGEVLEKSEATVRQLVSRARRRLGLDGERRFHSTAARAAVLAERFVAACRAGDVKAVEEMLAEDAEVHSDGGGRVSAARAVIRGRERVARFLAGVFSKKRRGCEMHPTTVNGEPGVVFVSREAVIQVTALSIEANVQAVYIIVNPDKLARWSAAEVE
jgi:RNA polymerase sigma-70 factor, ECF subfamily